MESIRERMLNHRIAQYLSVAHTLYGRIEWTNKNHERMTESKQTILNETRVKRQIELDRLVDVATMYFADILEKESPIGLSSKGLYSETMWHLIIYIYGENRQCGEDTISDLGADFSLQFAQEGINRMKEKLGREDIFNL